MSSPTTVFSLRFLSAVLISLVWWPAAWAGPYADKAKPREQGPELDRSAEVLGPDANANGVRDDLDAWLEQTYADPAERAAMTRAASALQATLGAKLEDQLAVRAVADRNARAVQCLWGFAGSPRLALPQQALRKLEQMTMNTPTRMAVYQVYARSIGNTLPPAGPGCVPEPAQSSR